MEDNYCQRCELEYTLDYPNNSPFFNQLVNIYNQNCNEMLINAIYNWIDELEITLEANKTQLPLFMEIDYVVTSINQLIKDMIKLLNLALHNIESESPNNFQNIIKVLEQKDKELVAIWKEIPNLVNKIEDTKYVKEQLEKSNIAIEYISEKILNIQEK